jgi:hypothetical protein
VPLDRRPIPGTGVLWIAPRFHYMTLFFYIVVCAAIGALVLGLILKVRLMRDQQVWEDLVDPNLPAKSSLESDWRNPDAGERYDIDVDEFEQNPDLQGEEMNTPPLSHSNNSAQEADLRRSSRIERPISLVVLGTNRRGEIFQERTAAVSLNLHGCRYSSRHEYAPEGWVTLQITGTDGANSRPVRARVRSVFSPQTTRELCQVGVELETPGNVWGIPAPPDDWQRLLVSNSNGAARPTMSPVAAQESAHSLASHIDRQAAAADRRAEVTVFPGPPTTPTTPVVEEGSEAQPTKAERVVITAEQLLQALQGKLQLAAEKAVQVSLSTQLDDAVKAALGRIEDGWKANVRETEQFSAARLADAQSTWDKELHTYRERAEDVARRIEALTALSQQALSDSQKFAERFAGETAPQLQARVSESFTKANSDFEAHAAELAARHMAEFNENTQRAINDARAQMDSTVQAHLASAPAGAPVVDGVSQAHMDAQLASFRVETSDRLEKRLGELQLGYEQQLDLARGRMNELGRQIEGLALESRQARAQHEQGLSEVRSLVSNTTPGAPQDQVNSLLKSSQDQILSHLEWRLGEVTSRYDQLLNQTNSHANQLSQHLDKLASDTRDHFAEARRMAEQAPRGIAPQDLAAIEQSINQATREFETAAARVSDRHLIRLMEQKQVVSQEASLELEARATEARSLLQKASNSTLEDFRRRVESQMSQMLAEATERVTSSIASLDAESRAAVDARRRGMEADVARAAEQSTAEFRSGIKAFLYSCLVAAVSAVDQHAQTTMAGLSSDPESMKRALEASASAAMPMDDTQFPPKSASSSQ